MVILWERGWWEPIERLWLWCWEHLAWSWKPYRWESIARLVGLRLCRVGIVLHAILWAGGGELVSQLVLAIHKLPHTHVHRSYMISPEVHHFVQGDWELGDHPTMNVSQQLALHTSQYAVPGHACDEVRVDRMITHSRLGKTQYLSLCGAATIPHLKEEFLRS